MSMLDSGYGLGVGGGGESGLGVALAGALLRDVDAAVDLLAVAAAGALVREVASLLKPVGAGNPDTAAGQLLRGQPTDLALAVGSPAA